MITVHPILHQTPLIGGRMKMICDHAKGCKVISCPDIVGHFENARCKPQKCYELEAQVACVPVDSLLEKSKENNRRFGAKDSKPKEEIIEGLAKLINKLIKDFDNEAHEYPCLLLSKCIITYLSSYGFVDSYEPDALIKQGEESLAKSKQALDDIESLIKQAKKEERDRIIKYLIDSNVISADGEYFKVLKQEGK